MEKPRLLIVSTVAITLRLFIIPFCLHFRSMGWTVDGMAAGISESAECREAFDRVMEVPWSRNPLDLPGLLCGLKQVRDVVSNGCYDLIHVHTPIAAFTLRWAVSLLKNRPPVIYTAHGFHFHEGGTALKNAIFLLFEKMHAQRTDRLIVINDEDYVAAVKHRLVPPERLIRMRGIGVDTEFFAPGSITAEKKRAIREQMGLGQEDHLVLMVAEFNPDKCHRDAILAIKSLDDKNVHLAFAGTGRLEKSLKEFAVRLGVSDRVHFLGFRSDVNQLMSAADATMLPSRREGLPRVVLESLSLGVPVIGSDSRGIRELLSDGCGILTKAGDYRSVAEAVKWVIGHPAEAASMAERGRRRVIEYDLRKIMKAHEDVYSVLLGLDKKNRGSG